MGQIMKKVLCSLLAALMIAGAVPVNAIAFELEKVGESIPAEEEVAAPEVEESLNNPKNGEYETMATPQYTITDTQMEENISKLISLAKNGYYFTTTGKSNSDYTKSAVASVIKADWLKKELGKVPSSSGLMPSGPLIANEKDTLGYQCFGFAIFANWYIFSPNNSGDIYINHGNLMSFTYNNIVKYAKRGDQVRIGNGVDNTDHSFIFLEVVDGNSIKVLDCNWSCGGTSKIKVHNLDFSSSGYFDTTLYPKMRISHVSNVTVKETDTVPVTGISLDYSDISIFKNDPFTLTATVYPSNATNKTVKWSSADTSVATVSSSGAVTGVSAGTTVITATTADGNYSASCDVEVIGDTYTITYDLNGGTWSRSNTQIKYEKQETYLAREIPVKEGFVFGGWEEIGECYELSPEKPESGDYTTYYKYYIWGYEHDSDYTYLYGNDKDELIDHIKKNAKTFGNYNPKKMRYFYLYETADKGSSFYPGKSGSNYNYFEAEYFSEGGEAGTAKIYKTEFYFEQRMYGYLTLGRFVHQAGDMYVVDEDLYLTAIWEYPESFNVYFDANGGHGGIEYLLVEGTQFTVPDTEDCIPVFENWLFLYWFDDEGIYEPGKTYTINEDKYLIAGWAPDWEPEITVGNITGKPGEVVSVPVNIMNNFCPDLARIEFDVICDGLTFFNFEQVGTPLHGLLGYLHIQIPDDAVAGRTYPVQLILNELVIEEKYDITELAKVTNGSITIEESEKEYTVTFDPGKGTGGPEDITVTGNEFTVPTEIPVRENWNFLFWMGQNGKGYYPGNTYSITENLDLVAIFEPGWMPEISVENVAGKPGEKVELRVTIANNMENPEDYFVIAGIKPYREDQEFDFTIVEFPQNGMIGKIFFTIPEDAKPGMVYEATIRADKWVVGGFDMASSEMLKFTNGSITVEEPEKATYTVTYDANGGSGAPAAQTKTEGEALKLSTTKPVREGYEFLGWATSKSATTAQYQPGGSYTKDESVTLYAVWKQKEVIPEDAPTIVIGEVSGKPGETVEVPVVLKNNPGIEGVTLGFEYDNTVLQLVEIKENKDLFPGTWMKNTGVTWASSSGNNASDGTFLTLVFEISEEADEGKTNVTVVYEEGDISDENMEDVNFVIDSGEISIVIRIPGDVNGDGKVNTKDFLTIMKYLAGDTSVSVVQGSIDVNNDGKENTKDFLTLMKYLAGEDIEIF